MVERTAQQRTPLLAPSATSEDESLGIDRLAEHRHVPAPLCDFQGELDSFHGNVITPVGEDQTARDLGRDEGEVVVVTGASRTRSR